MNKPSFPLCALTLVFVSSFGMSCSHPSAPTNGQSSAKIVFSKWTVDLIDVPALITTAVDSHWVDDSYQLKSSYSYDSSSTVINHSFSLFDQGHDTTVNLGDSLVGLNFRRVYSTVYNGGVTIIRVDTVCIDTRNQQIRYLSMDSTSDGGSHTNQKSYALSYSWRNIPYVISANGSLLGDLGLNSANSFQMAYSEGSSTHGSAASNSWRNTQLLRLLPTTSSSRIVIRAQ